MEAEDRKRLADKILYGMGLYQKLEQIGTPHIIGSYKMNMMAWNDIDIDIENSQMTIEKLHDLTTFILYVFRPTWYEAKEEVNDEGKTVWFQGFHTWIDGEMWNIDLWFFDLETIRKAEVYCNGIMEAVACSPTKKEVIMYMKQELIERDLYGFYKYSSMDVYRAVLEQNITTVDELLSEYVRKENRL